MNKIRKISQVKNLMKDVLRLKRKMKAVKRQSVLSLNYIFFLCLTKKNEKLKEGKNSITMVKELKLR